MLYGAVQKNDAYHSNPFSIAHSDPVLLCTFWSCYGRTGVIKKFWEWAYKSDKGDLIKIWLIYFSRSSSLYLYLHLLMDFWTTFSVAAIFNSHSNTTAWQWPYV